MTDTTATHRNAGTSRTPGSRLFASVPVLSLVPASLGIFLIAGPLLGLFLNIPWSQLGSIFTPQVLGAANLSLSTAAASTLICGLLGAPLALVLSKVLKRSRLHRFGSVLYAIIYTPVILSPVVSGLGLLFFWGRKGMIGTYLYQAGISIPFTPNALPPRSPPCRLFPANTKKLPSLKALNPQKSPSKCYYPSPLPVSLPHSCSPSPERSANTVQPSPSLVTSKVKPKLYPWPST